MSADVCFIIITDQKLNPRLLEKANQTDFPQPFTQLDNALFGFFGGFLGWDNNPGHDF